LEERRISRLEEAAGGNPRTAAPDNNEYGENEGESN